MEQDNLSAKSSDNAFGEALNNILSNPQMMSMISSIAKNLRADEASPSAQNAEETPTGPPEPSVQKLPDSVSALAPLLSTELLGKAKKDDRRACLLRALKPYMSDGRKEAIELIIKISMISDVLKNLS